MTTRLLGSNQYKTRSVETIKIQRDFGYIVIFLLIVAFLGREWVIAHPPISGCPSEGCEFVVQVQASEKKPLTKTEIINASNHPKEIMHIWKKESSYGSNTNPNALHNICKAQGKSNEFGYGGMQMMICFNTFEEAVKKVDAWLDKESNIALCYYNVGIKKSDCDYVK